MNYERGENRSPHRLPRLVSFSLGGQTIFIVCLLVKRLFLILVPLVMVYIGSYAWFRSSHVERSDRDGRHYVIFPQQPALYYLYRPLTYFDAQLTGMRFHIGPHRSCCHANRLTNR
jgi:hypothetical protein